MRLHGSFVGALALAATIGSNVGRAQEPPGAARRDTTVPARGATGVGEPAKPHAVQVCIDCHGWPRASQWAAIILKDSDQRVLMMVGPGDTLAPPDTTTQIDPAWVANIDIVKPVVAAATLGTGFEQGLAIVTLTPAGSNRLRHRRAQKTVPRCAP